MTNKKNQPEDLPGRRILALETATDVSSVALFEDGKLMALQENHAHRTHARLVTVMIERMLKDLDWTTSSLSAVAVAKGPGSYTGLRVGVSVAKGLCMALDIPLISLGSLEALACLASPFARRLGAQICPMIDARRMEVFCQRFDHEAQPIGTTEALIIDESSFAERLEAGPLIFCGDGAAKCLPLLGQHPNAVFLEGLLSSATGMGQRADHKLQNQELEDLVTFEPFYLKEFVATLSNKKQV